MELAITKSVNIALPGTYRKTVLLPHSSAPTSGVLILAGADLFDLS